MVCNKKLKVEIAALCKDRLLLAFTEPDLDIQYPFILKREEEKKHTHISMYADLVEIVADIRDSCAHIEVIRI